MPPHFAAARPRPHSFTRLGGVRPSSPWDDSTEAARRSATIVGRPGSFGVDVAEAPVQCDRRRVVGMMERADRGNAERAHLFDDHDLHRGGDTAMSMGATGGRLPRGSSLSRWTTTRRRWPAPRSITCVPNPWATSSKCSSGTAALGRTCRQRFYTSPTRTASSVWRSTRFAACSSRVTCRQCSSSESATGEEFSPRPCPCGRAISRPRTTRRSPASTLSAPSRAAGPGCCASSGPNSCRGSPTTTSSIRATPHTSDIRSAGCSARSSCSKRPTRSADTSSGARPTGGTTA